MKNAKITLEGQTLSVYLLCEIDHHTAKSIRADVDERLMNEKPKILVLDFSKVSFMDSSGIGLILGRASKAEEIGAKVVIKGLSPTQKKLVRMSGMEKLEIISVI